ncbi:MAG: hypothetical protein ABGY43_01835, partial [bacterium]
YLNFISSGFAVRCQEGLEFYPSEDRLTLSSGAITDKFVLGSDRFRLQFEELTGLPQSFRKRGRKPKTKL